MVAVGESSADGIDIDYHELDSVTESQLIGEAISQNPELVDAGSKYVLLTLVGESPFSNVARALECKQFQAYFGNSPEDMAVEYGPYESQSIFFLVAEREKKEAAGVMRVILPGPAGLKSTNDIATDKCLTLDDKPATVLTTEEVFSQLQLEPEKTVDIATIAVKPEYGEKTTGSPVVLAALMRALHKLTHTNGYDELVGIIDEVPQNKLISVGLPVENPPHFAKPFKYLGAEGNSFMHIHVPYVDEAVSAKDKATFDYVFGEMALFHECELSLIEQ